MPWYKLYVVFGCWHIWGIWGYGFLLCYSHIRMKIKNIPFFNCSIFPLHFVIKLESQLSMFTSIPTLLHIFSCPYGGVRYNLKNGISINVHSHYSCGNHFTEKTAHFPVYQCVIVTEGAENSMFMQLLKWYFSCGIESLAVFKE